MKPYRKPIMAVDSPWCIVMDDKVKYVSLWIVLLKVCGWISLFGLTCFGLIGGVTSKFAQDKLQSLDKWSSSPANAEFLFYTGIGFLSVVLLWFVMYWVYRTFAK